MFKSNSDIKSISTGRLRDVIETQTCVATLGLDLNAVMEMVAERSRFITNSVASTVELADDNNMVFRSVSGNGSKFMFQHVSGGNCLCESCAAGDEASSSDENFRNDRIVLRQNGPYTILVVPLNHLDQRVGVLKLMSENPSGFTGADMDILELMSPLFSASLYNATRYGTSALFQQATTDGLTGLPNRGLFLDRLRSAHMIAKRENRQMGVLMLDMDDLKSINDRFGHRAGDAAILEMGQRIKAEVRDADTVARFGGDEFAVVLYKLENHIDECSAIDRINRHHKQPFVFEGNIIPLRISIGMALYPEDSGGWEKLIGMADRRMYEHKRGKMRLTCPLDSALCSDCQFFPGQRPVSVLTDTGRDRP